MSVTFTKQSDNFFTLHIQGAFSFEDLGGVQDKARAEVDRSQKNKVLILAEQFTGWGKEGDWGDLAFMHEFDPCLEKIAVVSQGKWEDHMLLFLGAGMRQAMVQFFDVGQEENARKWLQGDDQ